MNEYVVEMPKRIVLDSFEQRMARARETVPPGEFLGYTFIAIRHGWIVKAISETELGVFNEKPK